MFVQTYEELRKYLLRSCTPARDSVGSSEACTPSVIAATSRPHTARLHIIAAFNLFGSTSVCPIGKAASMVLRDAGMIRDPRKDPSRHPWHFWACELLSGHALWKHIECTSVCCASAEKICLTFEMRHAMHAVEHPTSKVCLQ